MFNMSVATGQFLPGDGPRRGAASSCWAPSSSANSSAATTRSASGCGWAAGFRVIGVLAEKGSFSASTWDDTAFIPAARGLEVFNRSGLSEIHLTYDPAGGEPHRRRRGRRPCSPRATGRADFTVTTQEEMLSTLSNILDILTMAVAALGASLLVGAVGIVTIMTIAVAERTPEVGLMMALGGERRVILWLFLGEAVVLAVLGSLLGVAIGSAWPSSSAPGARAAGGHAAAVRAAGGGQQRRDRPRRGVPPARHAAHLDPVEALRAE